MPVLQQYNDEYDGGKSTRNISRSTKDIIFLEDNSGKFLVSMLFVLIASHSFSSVCNKCECKFKIIVIH